MRNRYVLFCFILHITLFAYEKDVLPFTFGPGGPLYDQKVTKKTYPKGNFNAMKNTLTAEYAMGQISLSYFHGSWSIPEGNHMIYRSTDHGMPAYDNSIDTFFIDTLKLTKIRTSEEEWEYTASGSSSGKLYMINPENISDTYWKMIDNTGAIKMYRQVMNGRRKNGNSIARGWLLSEIIKNDRFKQFEYQEINGDYILRRVTSGDIGKGIDTMTFIEYEFAGQNRRLDFRFGVKVEKSHFPRAVYIMQSDTTANYPWLTDISGDAYAYVYKNKTYRIKTAFLLDWKFGRAGEWQLKKITPYQSDICFKIKRWWDESGIVREMSAAGGTTGKSTSYEYFPYIQHFSNWHIFKFDSSSFPDALFDQFSTEMVDLNNDNLIDIIKMDKGTNTLQGWYNMSNIENGELKFSTCREIQKLPKEDNHGLHHGGGGIYDWNNDKIPDRIYISDNLNTNLKVCCGKLDDKGEYYIESDIFANYDYWDEFFSFQSEEYSLNYKTSIDMDGDQLPDKVKAEHTTGNLIVSHAKTLYSDTIEYQNFGGGKPRDITTINEVYSDLNDMNGDGLPDRVVKKRDVIAIRYNVGESFSDAIFTYSDPDIESIMVHERSALTYDYIDYNGDGLLDRIRKKKGEPLHVWFNTGMGFSNDIFTLDKLPDDDAAIRDVATVNYYKRFYHSYLDMNGDGAPDRVVNKGDGKISVAYNQCIQNGIPSGTLKSVVGPVSGSKNFQKNETYHSNGILSAIVEQNMVKIIISLDNKQVVKFNLFDILGRRVSKTATNGFNPGVQTFQLHVNKNISETGSILILCVESGSERFSYRISNKCTK